MRRSELPCSLAGGLAAILWLVAAPVLLAQPCNTPRWTPLSNEPPPAGSSDMVYDEVRGRTVVVCRGEMWEFDGAAWTKRQISFPANSLSLGSMAYDEGRAKVVFPSAAGMWEYDGSHWELRSTPHGPQTSGIMVPNRATGRMVLVSGSGETWEYDGNDWEQRFPSSGQPFRYHFAMAYDGARGRVVLYGGFRLVWDGSNPHAPAAVPLNDTWEYDGINWAEQVTADHPPVTGEMVYHGGLNRLLMVTPQGTWEYDGANWAERSGTPNPNNDTRLVYHRATNKVVGFGGFAAGGSNSETWEYDGANWVRRPGPAQPPQMNSSVIAYDAAAGKTVLVGCPTGSLVAQTWEFDGAAWQRRMTSTEPPARPGAAMAWHGVTGKMVLFGGNTTLSTDTWEYDGTDWTLRVTANSPPARSSQAMAFNPSTGKIVLFGGSIAFPNVQPSTWEYDGANWSERTTAASPPFAPGVMAYDPTTATMVLYMPRDSSASSETWEYDGNNWTRRIGASSPRARSGHAMTYDAAAGRIVLFGVRNGAPADTWEYDGTTWFVHETAARPNYPHRPTIAYHASSGRTVLLDGVGTPGSFTETWEYDHTNWVARFPLSRPPARNSGSMIYDSVRGRIVLFGDQNGLADTWEYDGASWLQRFPVASPAARGRLGMAFDSARNKVVLFGGSRSIGNDLLDFGDTWEYDGTNWIQLPPAAGPSARSGHAMAYNPNTGKTVLFGGTSVLPSGSVSLSDTWEFDGSSWTQRTPATSPSPRGGAAMAYYGATGKLVLFGGADGNQLPHSDTWEYDGSNWFRSTTAEAPSGELSICYNGATNKVTMGGGGIADVWEFNHSNWTRRSASVPLAGQGLIGFHTATGDMLLLVRSPSETWLWTAAPLSIRRHPLSRQVVDGAYTDLSIVAEGAPPLTYRWNRNGLPLDDTDNVIGSTSNVLQVRAMSRAEMGVYSCIVTDRCGNALTSTAAHLPACRSDFNLDGMVAALDLLDFLNAWFASSAGADFNGGGVAVDDIFDFLSAWLTPCP